MGVEGEGVSLTEYGRTRDSRLDLLQQRSDVPARAQRRILCLANRSDLVCRQLCDVFDTDSAFLTTGRGSPPMFLEESMNRIFSLILRTGYITANNRR